MSRDKEGPIVPMCLTHEMGCGHPVSAVTQEALDAARQDHHTYVRRFDPPRQA